MKNILFLALLFSFSGRAQNPTDILDRISMIQMIVENPNGDLIFRQTKNWCTDFLDYNESQAKAIDGLFETQYSDLALAYKNYSIDNSPENLDSLIRLIVKQEKYYRLLLRPEQLTLYKNRFSETFDDPENPKNKAFNALFFSDEMLQHYEN